MSEPDRVELYWLADPRTGQVRYIGKANCARKRLMSHIRDAKCRNGPVHRWLRELLALGLVPALHKVERVLLADWPTLEQVAIEDARSAGVDLLNVAPGGEQPYCPTETRRANGRRIAIVRADTPEKARTYRLKQLLGQALRQGYCTDQTREKMRYAARRAPHIFGLWVDI